MVCGAKPGQNESSCQGISWIPLSTNAYCKSVMHFEGVFVDLAIMFREFQMFCRNRISRSSRNLYLKATMTVWVQGENCTLWTRDWLCWLQCQWCWNERISVLSIKELWRYWVTWLLKWDWDMYFDQIVCHSYFRTSNLGNLDMEIWIWKMSTTAFTNTETYE